MIVACSSNAINTVNMTWIAELLTQHSSNAAGEESWIRVDRLDGYVFEVTCSCLIEAGAEPSVSTNGETPAGRCGMGTYVTTSAAVGCITGEEVCTALANEGFPADFDLLKATGHINSFQIVRCVLMLFRPRVVIASINTALGTELDLVVPDCVGHYRDNRGHFGSSYQAVRALAARFSYVVAYVDWKSGNVVLLADEYALTVTQFSPEQLEPVPDVNASQSDRHTMPYLTSAHYLVDGVKTYESKYGRISYFCNDEFIGAHLSSGRYWQEGIIKTVAEVLQGSTGMALDIGAHVGTHALAISALVPGLSFICYEPQRPLFLLLERNIYENRLESRIQARCLAVGHASRDVNLSKTASDGISVGKQLQYGSVPLMNLGGVQLGLDGQPCTLTSIDSESLHNVRYVKIDVEGAEPLVCRGMQNTVRQYRPIVLYENRKDRTLPDSTCRMLGISSENVSSPTTFFRSHGYSIEWHRGECIAIPPLRGTAQKFERVAVSSIPRRIFQTWKTHRIPSVFQAWSASFGKFNPTYTHEIWDDLDNNSFIEAEFPWFIEAYRGYASEIYRADAIRYFYLYTFGGIYADMDTECLRPLDSLLTLGDVVLGRMGTNRSFPHSIPNAIMASRPKQQFWLLLISILLQRSTMQRRPEFITGPILLKSAVDLYLDNNGGSALDRIRQIASFLKPDQQPDPTPSSLAIVDPRLFYGIDWSNEDHQELRRHVLSGGSIGTDLRNRLFGKAWMVTYWSHTWE